MKSTEQAHLTGSPVPDLRGLWTFILGFVCMGAAVLLFAARDLADRSPSLAIVFIAAGLFMPMNALRGAIGYDARYQVRVAAASASPVPAAGHAAHETASVDGGSR